MAGVWAACWRVYRQRFVPWIALNMLRERRTLRIVHPETDRLAPNAIINSTLFKLFQQLSVKGPKIGSRKLKDDDGSIALVASEGMFKALGFTLSLDPSLVSGAGIGVFVKAGRVSQGEVVCMYAGTVYEPGEPVLLQSLGNRYLFRCIDGLLIDGKAKGLSRLIYRSCSGRDWLGPHPLSDTTWLSADRLNPAAVGQYVNNCCPDRPANVAYQEFDVPLDFPLALRRFLPNVPYTSQPGRLCTCEASLRNEFEDENANCLTT
uniref:SET domain-containing protein 9 isoform X2 n=1 Tax=Myxine glutinosa TaxID=7769 RepID=UPI00358F9EED